MPNANPPSPKRVLGRGLADLIPLGGSDVRAAGVGASEGDSSNSRNIPVGEIQPNPKQPRTRFDETALEELAASIRANGILQPILVRPRVTGGYEIVAGERRYRAALRAGLSKVPAVVRDLSDEETLALALIENLIRQDIGPIETARAFRRLMDDFGWTQEEMGQRVGRSRPAIANSLRLLELPETIQQSVDNGEISEGHARALLGDRKQRADESFQKRQQSAWEAARAGGTVRDIERRMAPPSPTQSAPARDTIVASSEWTALEDQLRTALGTRVRLLGDNSRGKVEIEFYSPDELDGLLQKLVPPTSPQPLTVPEPKEPQREEPTHPVNRIQGLLTSQLRP